MFFQPFIDALTCARKYEAEEFIPLTIGFNGARGYVHKSVAPLLFKEDFLDRKIIRITPKGEIEIGTGVGIVEQINAILAELTTHLEANHIIGRIRKNEHPSLSRVTDTWDERPWDELKATIPVADSRLIAALGLKQYNVHCIGHKTDENGDEVLVLGERAAGYGRGQLDYVGGGKRDADKNTRENMETEIGQEANLSVKISPDDPFSPQFIGTIHTCKQHGNKLFRREIALYAWNMQQHVPTPSNEVREFIHKNLNRFYREIDNVWGDPATLSKYPYYVAVGVGYFMAKLFKDRFAGEYIKHADGQIVPRLHPVMADEIGGYLRAAETEPEIKALSRIRRVVEPLSKKPSVQL